MSQKGGQAAEESALPGVGIRAIEWKIAWRHLRRGGTREVPSWVQVSLLGAVYLTLAGLAFLLYAASGIEAVAGEQLFSGGDLSPSQRWFGIIGATGLFVGVLWLILSLLATFFNLLATIISVSVLLGCMALVVVLSLMTGLEGDLRDKILNQKAHILVSAQDGNRFADYDSVVEALEAAPSVAGASPYVEGEVMAKSGFNRQGGLLRGVQSKRIVTVSNLDEIIRRGKFEWLDNPELISEGTSLEEDESTPWRLRHLEGKRPEEAEPAAGPRTWAVFAPLALMLLVLGAALRRMPLTHWLIPSGLVALVAAGLVVLAPPGAEPLGPTKDDSAFEPAADDPMLERLKPKPLDNIKLPDVGDEPDAPKAGTGQVAPVAGIIKDPSGFGAGTDTEDGPEARDYKIMPVDVDAAKSALAPSGDNGGHGDEDGGWEDPLEELGIENRRPAPPIEAVELRPTAKPTLPGDLAMELSREARAAQRAKREADRVKAQDEEEGWEDPIEELGLPTEAEVAPAATGGGTGTAAPGGAEPKEIAPNMKGVSGVPDGILIGNELAMELAVRVGNPVQLITPIGRMTPAGRVPGLLSTRVGGIFYSGNYEFDRKNLYAPLPVVQRFLRTGDRVSGIEIKIHEVDKIRSAKAEVVKVIEAQGRSAELHVETWEELNKNLFSAMLLEKIAMGVALLFVVLVASFGILASNLMSVIEKAREIAILKAMGAPDIQIQRVFVAEGLCVGLIGATGGLFVGLGLCLGLSKFGFPFDENVYYIEQLPVVVNPVEVLIVGIAALGIIWASSLYPAHRAARMKPVDGLRENDR